MGWSGKCHNKSLHRYFATINLSNIETSQCGYGSKKWKHHFTSYETDRIFLQHKWCSAWACVGIDVSSPLCNRDCKLLRGQAQSRSSSSAKSTKCHVDASQLSGSYHHSCFHRGSRHPMSNGIMILSLLGWISSLVQTDFSGLDVYMCMGKSLSLSLGLEEHRFTHVLFCITLSPLWTAGAHRCRLTKTQLHHTGRQWGKTNRLVCVCVHLSVGLMCLGSRPVHLPFCCPTSLFRPDRIVSAPAALKLNQRGQCPTQLTQITNTFFVLPTKSS